MDGVQILAAEIRLNAPGDRVSAVGQHIRDRNTLAIHIPGTLGLVRRNSAAPKEIFRKSHSFYLLYPPMTMVSFSMTTSPTSSSFITRTGTMVGQPAALIAAISNSSRSWPFLIGREGLKEIRRQVVRLKELGKTGKEIEELTGVRQNRASEIWTAYQREGTASLERKKYGRKPGSHMVLTPEEQENIREAEG